MSKVGNVLRSITKAISLVFNKLKQETRELVPIAIAITEGLKKVMDTPVDDILLTIIKGAIKGEADNLLIDKIKLTVETWIPKILIELKMVQSIANIEDQNTQLQAILAELKLSSDETKNIVLHGISSLILEKLSDGKLTWSESVQIGEYYYKNFPTA